jgi:transcriptional regulator with XRE-family HTH domain
MLAMSQRDLADALDIAQQQLQKYETGQNRISASRLYEAARILKAPVAWFYEGLDDPEAEEGLQIVLGMADGETLLRLSQGEIESLLRAYANDPDRRQRLLQILNMLVVPPRP